MQAKQVLIIGAIVGTIMFAIPQANAEAHFVLRVDPLSLIVGTQRHHHTYYRSRRPTPKIVFTKYKHPRRFKRSHRDHYCDNKHTRNRSRKHRNW